MTILASTFVQRQARLFHAGAFDEMVRAYAFPLPVEQDGAVVVYSDPAQYQGALALIRATLLAGGMTGLCGRLAARELTRDARFRVWVSLDLIYADRIDLAAVRFVHYCRQTAERIQVEMVKMLHNPAETSFCPVVPPVERRTSA